MGLVGILEYDSEYPNYKASHRNFLASQSYIKVIPVENIEIFKRDFYLNYLKDVVLARFLDDSTFNLIASLIYSNHLKFSIILKIQKFLNIYSAFMIIVTMRKTNAIVLMMMMTMMMIISK